MEKIYIDDQAVLGRLYLQQFLGKIANLFTSTILLPAKLSTGDNFEPSQNGGEVCFRKHLTKAPICKAIL